MTTTKANNKEREKLVNNIPPDSLEVRIPEKGLTNRPIRRITVPYLRAHKVKGRLYYTYCRGTDKEIYLGDADSILRAVKGSQNRK